MSVIGSPALLPTVGYVLRLTVGIPLLITGIAKGRDPVGTRVAVDRYRLVPPRLLPAIAGALPIVEIGAGAGMLTGVLLRSAAALAALLYMVFAAAVAINLRRGRSFDCGCHGVGAQRRIGWPLVAVDIAAAVSAAVPAGAGSAGGSPASFGVACIVVVVAGSVFRLAASARRLAAAEQHFASAQTRRSS